MKKKQTTKKHIINTHTYKIKWIDLYIITNRSVNTNKHTKTNIRFRMNLVAAYCISTKKTKQFSTNILLIHRKKRIPNFPNNNNKKTHNLFDKQNRCFFYSSGFEKFQCFIIIEQFKCNKPKQKQKTIHNKMN